MTDDILLATKLVDGLCKQDTLKTIVAEGDPISKARARFTRKGRPYTPQSTVDGEKYLAFHMRDIEKFKSNVAVACVFFRKSRQRVDVDNLMKAVLDSGTRAGVWDDDSQVTALVGIIQHDPVRPRTVVCFGDHVSSLTRGDAAKIPCRKCGTLFFPGGAARRQNGKFCSLKCKMTLDEPVTCPGCGGPFKRRNSNSKYCSLRCRGIAQSARDRAARKSRTHCVKGHILDDANTHVLANGRRRCRKCQAEAVAQYRAEKQ